MARYFSPGVYGVGWNDKDVMGSSELGVASGELRVAPF